jgi:hypothetical protein
MKSLRVAITEVDAPHRLARMCGRGGSLRIDQLTD